VVPPTRALLRWLYLGRVAVATGVFIGAAFAWWQANLTQLLIATISMTSAVIMTAVSAWYSHLRPGQRIGATFLYAQAVFDLALVSAVVYIGGPYTYFAALYILVIAINAMLMPLFNGLLVALLAGILYAAVVAFAHPVELEAALLLQIAVYWLVAVATGYLASRVRVAGAATESLAAELRRARLEANDILRHIRTGIMTVSGDGRLVYANPHASALLGFSSADLNMPVLERLDRMAPILGDSIRRTANEGRRVVRREADVTVGDRTFPIGVTTTAVNVGDGGPPSVTAIFKEISDEKRLEALHLRTERLEAVAELAASLAHEIKNPLASIRSAVEQLSRLTPQGADERVLGGLIVRESDRLSRLLTEFLDFTRVRVTSSAPLDLVSVAEGGIRLARQHPDCPSSAAIDLEAAERPITVEGDEDLLHRVVFNLVLNAVQVQPERARVTVEVAIADPFTLPAGLSLDSPRVLRVRDQGPGVASDVLPRLFEPFVTGRPGGTGLGLPIVQRAVQAHRGAIFCDSVRGRGTTFTIYIPARFSREEAA
jgi:two-component system sensor histidine kinase PilS (NtrC family)